MRYRVVPRHNDVRSRPWAFYVNVLAASPLVGRARRRDIYRRAGLDVANAEILPGCHVNSSMLRLGRDVILNHGVFIENTALVEIGDRTGLGMQAAIITSTHEIGTRHRRYGEWRPRPVRIGEGVWIGARAMILGGVTVGDGCVIAAGALVTKDCERDGLYAGVPARRIRDLEPGDATPDPPVDG